ncbi:VCBS domain-containing protein [Rhizobium sp. C4]|uniref:VCBS domain-containing protein n=1 Tax=Rhizobium sp. C4 TaxID=1349800 RepID=UPI001E4B1049|nr:VCBS domain-containing protein [Rhizobium sp. C4]MCD2175782.1 VCBS domain-containing protein [Rhizobium sp. C4]
MSIVSDRSHNPDLTFVSGPVTGGGQVSLSQTGILTFDPNGAFNNLTKGQSATVSLDVRVESASSNTIFIVPVEFVVTGANEVPVVIDGHLDAVENGATVAMKLMSLVKTTGLDDGLAPTFAIVEQPEKGLASIANGQLVFNPAKGFDDLAKGESRDVDVTVRVTNSQGETADATVTVTVTGINDAPTISDKALKITESASATIDIASLAGDVDSDDNANTLTYAVTGEPKLGSASLKGTTLSFETGSAFESLSKGETRSVEIDLSATDRHGLSGKGTVTITVTGENDAPILSAGRLSAVEDGASVALDLAKLASDIDTDDDGKTLTYSIVKGPLEGTAKLSGTSLIFDPGQGFQSLEDGQTRDVTVVVRATDSHGASADATVTVTVTGQYDGETLLLSDIATGEGGFRIVGERAGDMAGLSVSSAGDFNGDGFDDFIIGAPGNDATGGPGDLPATLTDHGAVYVVYGQQQRPDQINLDDIAAGRGGFKIVPGSTIVRDPFGSPAISPDANHFTGMSVAAAGDVNGDGFADILMGGPGSTQLRFDGDTFVANPGVGGAYVIFGQANTIGSVNLDDIGDAVSGFRIEGESVQSLSGPFPQSVTGIFAGMDVASAGDVNGDGLDDLVIGSRDGAYIVLGQAGETTVNLDAVADGIGGFKVTFPSFPGSANVLGGVTVSALGDIDKDGFDDVAVGSHFGISRIIYGSATLGASGSPAISSITVEGASLRPDETIPSAERSLITISALGDINGDGIDDFMVGVPSNAEGGAQAGAAYVVFGREGVRSDLSLTDIANGIGGFKITGEAAGNAAGISVAAAGDLNGDGFTDLVVGASTDRNLPLSQLGLNLLDEAVAQAGSGAGSAYVVYGTAHAPSEINLDTIALGIGGFKLVGEAGGDHAGIAVASAGDIDGDGLGDLLVGANLNDAGGADAGAAYVVYGGFSLPNDTDHAHIAGDLDGDVIGSRVETATGRLTATFADGRSEGFVATTRQGDYGSFTLLADGSWTYRLDPENASVKALTFGKTLAESFKVMAEDGSAIAAVAIDIKAPPPVTGDLTASLIEDYRLTASGTITAQGTAQFVPLLQVQGVFGTFDLAADGHWHYQLDPFSDAVQALLPGDDAIERFAVATTDGAGLGTVTLHIDGTFDFSTFGGDRTASISEDAPGAAGTVKAIDRYAGALEYLAKDVQGVYGTFHLGSNGAWTYDLDNDKAAVRSLATGATLTEQFVVSEAEGRFTQAVSIQITGANDAPIVTAINAGTVGEDDAIVTINLLAGQSDEETTALSAVSIAVKDNLGHAVTFVDNGNGTISIDPAQFNALRNGESRTLTVSYAVSDGTTSTANSATLTVNGFADQTTPLANDDTISANVQTGEFLVNSELASDQFGPAVTALSNGGFVVTWIAHDYPGNFPDFSSIKAQIFDAGGMAVGAEFLVNAQTNTYREVPAITALTNGGFVITWQNDEQVFNRAATEIRAQIFAADGSPVGKEFLVNSQTNDTQQAPDITALTGGGFVITWHSYDGVEDQSEFGVKAQIFDAGGAPVGDEFLVNTRTDSNQTSPAITALSTGGFVVTWESHDGIDDASDYEIRAQIFDANGAAVGAEHLVNTRTANGQFEPDITALSNGGFVITWTSDDHETDTSGYGIKAQIFDAHGNAVGSEFIVNNQMAGDQTKPAITALSNGGFVMAWESSDRVDDTSGLGIKARLFDANGTPVGREFLVNTDTESSQRHPAIAALANGGFVITWQGLDASASGVKAQIYDAQGNPARADLSAGTVHTITVASLLGNDTDGDGDTLSITGVSPTSALGAAVALNGDGTISIDPRSVTALQALGAGERLADTFTYTISDGHGGTDTATVNLTYRGVNDAPNVVAIDAGAVSEDDTVATINLLAGQTDAESSALSVRDITAIDNLGHTVAFVDHGDGTIGIDPAQFNALDFNSFRDITIAYTVSDGVLDVANIATLRVQGYNDAAEITGTITGMVREDGQLSTSGRLFASDPDVGQSSFDTQSLSPGLYGGITIDADGSWTYQLDNWRPEVQALNNGDVLTDEIYIPTVDGTMTMITIAVQGTDEPGVTVIEAPAQILLSSLAGSPYGLKIVGGAFGDRAGYSVSSAGDFNGDGVDDLLVSAMYGGDFGGRVAASAAMVSDGGGGQDTAFVLFGGYSLGGTIDLADVGFSIGGVRITAESDTIQNGITVASLGDFNGDGLDDIAIGAHSDHEAGYSAGAAYIIYGTTEAPQTLQLSEIAIGHGGFKILGENDYDTAGTSVSAAGDINGDGYADVIIGAPNNSSTADYSDSTGAAYVILGSRDRNSTLDLQLMQKGSDGFKIAGEEPYQLAGYAVSSAGDFNQDGYGDYVIGAYGGYSNGFYKGAAYLVYGSGNSISSIDLGGLGFGVGGFKISGVAEFDETGFAVAAAGDVNGDGLDDFLIGAPFDAPYYGMVEGAMAGKAYVVYGRGDVPYGVDLEHMTLGTDGGTRSAGLRIIGEDDLDRAGVAVSSAGDINGDGLADILVGAPGNGEGRSEAGAAYVIFCESERTGDIHLSDIAAGKGGFKLVGEAAGDVAGSTVAAAGDVNGDGFDDLLVGARGNDVTEGDDRGAAYVLFGGAYLGSQDYRGTENDDTISVSNTAFTRIDGKSGFDTLLVQGTDMMLDFTKLAQDRVSSIEMIDMTGHGNNSIKLTAEDVFDMSQAIDGDTTSLVVRLDTGDTLDLSGDGWTSGGTRVEGGRTYELFTNSILGLHNVDVLVGRFEYNVD